MILNTVFLPILLYANIFGVKPGRYISFITLIFEDLSDFANVSSLTLNSDFEPIWYRNVSPVFTNYVIIDTLFTWIMFGISKLLAKRRDNIKSEEGKILQKSMNEKITAWKLNIYIENSYFNLIVFLCLFLCSGIPILLPLGFINLLSKYLSNRYLLQNHSSRIEGLSEKFNSFPLGMIPILLIVSCIVGCWMITAIDTIYPDALSIGFKFRVGMNVWNRQIYLPYYFILAIIVLFSFLFYHLIVKLIQKIRSCWC